MLGPGPSRTAGGVLGNAAVQHTGAYGPGVCGTSFGVLACAEMWLGKGDRWDVIHFNWGLHDIDASMYANVSLDEYAENMEALYGKLKAALRPRGNPTPRNLLHFDSNEGRRNSASDRYYGARIVFEPQTLFQTFVFCVDTVSETPFGPVLNAGLRGEVS